MRILIVLGGGVLAVAVIYFLIHAVLYDNCTASYDRSPQAVVQSYVAAIESGDVMRGMNCWSKNNYYSLENGCSEICLQRVWGLPMTLSAADFGAVSKSASGRDEISVQVTALCPDGSTQESAQITLDTANESLPWAHWKIVQSSLGGTVAAPWCR